MVKISPDSKPVTVTSSAADDHTWSCRPRDDAQGVTTGNGSVLAGVALQPHAGIPGQGQLESVRDHSGMTGITAP